MVSLITSSNAHNLISPVVSPLGLGTDFKITTAAALAFVKKDRFLGFNQLKKTRTRRVVLCKGSLESEEELVLEREILDFMKISKNPKYFPTKKELLDGGRIDLVDAIIKKGGWLSLGWDDSDDENEWDSKEVDDCGVLNTRLGSSLSSCSSTHQFASSSGRSAETVVQEDVGIEGILHRLEKHRSLSFGHYASNKDNGGHRAAETYWVEKSNQEEEDLQDKVLATQGDAGLQERHKELDSNYIKSRLQQLQFELSSSLCLLKSKSEACNPKGHESSSTELQRLSDSWEFQENEITNAKDRLRSIRAELAVLEGKMALSINNAQKLIEAKQRRIDSGCKTLQILRTTCIIWHSSASEVLLAGSFDGWTTQIKMDKSETGVFSLSLKLYPGRYEIKFIVDGVWRVDPLRPIVNNNGYENNVLIIHE